MLAIVMNSMECNGYATLVALTSRVAFPPVCHRKAFYTGEFLFSYFDSNDRKARKVKAFLN